MNTPNPKRALVTGASGAIGRAIALKLALDGAHVIVHANSRLAAAQTVVDEIVAAGGSAEINSEVSWSRLQGPFPLSKGNCD